jgi:hypothetical protein
MNILTSGNTETDTFCSLREVSVMFTNSATCVFVVFTWPLIVSSNFLNTARSIEGRYDTIKKKFRYLLDIFRFSFHLFHDRYCLYFKKYEIYIVQ